MILYSRPVTITYFQMNFAVTKRKYKTSVQQDRWCNFKSCGIDDFGWYRKRVAPVVRANSRYLLRLLRKKYRLLTEAINHLSDQPFYNYQSLSISCTSFHASEIYTCSALRLFPIVLLKFIFTRFVYKAHAGSRKIHFILSCLVIKKLINAQHQSYIECSGPYLSLFLLIKCQLRC